MAAGSIIRTEPAAGSQVAAGSTVVVYVSRPQVNTTAKVPALTGLKSVNDARSVLVQNKLGLGSTTEQYSDQPAGTIIGQSPAAGSTVKVNSRVSITVSAGPEPVPETPAEQPGSSSSDWWSGLIEAALPAAAILPAVRAPAWATGGVRCCPEEERMKGYIVKGIGGFYYVKTEEGVIECKPGASSANRRSPRGGR